MAFLMKHSNLFHSLLIFSFLSLHHYHSPSSANLLVFDNPRLGDAFIALQAWKAAIIDDPNGVTATWIGCEVCNYTGVFCAPAIDDNYTTVVAGIDLNHQNISGWLPEELGLLKDLALFHLNSNRFHGAVPSSLQNLHLLYELDISNNRFSGEFPSPVLGLPSLKYLDIRFNGFRGAVPSSLFDMKLDALFINDNSFQFTIPANFGNLTASALVFANNRIGGCLPPSIGNLAGTLQELILRNSSLGGCLPEEIGLLTNLTVLDVEGNKFVGHLPDSIRKMVSLEQLNIAHNEFSGDIPDFICELPRLQNFTYAYNYFQHEDYSCIQLPTRGRAFDDQENCIPHRPKQRSEEECHTYLYHHHPIDCNTC